MIAAKKKVAIWAHLLMVSPIGGDVVRPFDQHNESRIMRENRTMSLPVLWPIVL